MEKQVHVKLKKVKLSEVREKLNITQEELSRLLDVDRGHINQFESGKKPIRWLEKAIKLQKLLKRVGLSIEDLDLSSPLNEQN